MFTPDFIQPQSSSQTNFSVVSTFQVGSITAFQFRRPLKSNCDQPLYQQTITPNKPFWLIFALGTSNTFGYHSTLNRGQKLLDVSGTYFGSSEQKMNLSDPSISVVNLTTSPLAIPAVGTSYCYTWYDFSNMTKHHIIQETPIIKSPYLHHYASYVCATNPSSDYSWITSGGSNTCNLGKFSPQETCYKTYNVWAKGMQGRSYPSNTGKPVGKDTVNPVLYLLLGKKKHFGVEEVVMDS